MKIAVIGKGSVGGGLADLWEEAGHELTRSGRDGGDVADADAVLLATPGGAIAEALDGVTGLEGQKSPSAPISPRCMTGSRRLRNRPGTYAAAMRRRARSSTFFYRMAPPADL